MYELALVILYSIVIVLLDSYMYGVIKEVFIDRKNSPIGIFIKFPNEFIFNILESFWKFLFKKHDHFLFIKFSKERETAYRVLQKIWEIGFMFLIFYITNNLWPIIGILIAHIFVVFDFGYYIILGQLENAKSILNPYWLMYKFNIGHYWKPYDYKKFKYSFIIGIIFMILFSAMSLIIVWLKTFIQ